MRFVMLGLAIAIGMIFTAYSLQGFEKIVDKHGKVVEYSVMRHPKRIWKKIQYICPKKVYAGTAKVAKNGNHKKEIICCYPDNKAELVKNVQACKPKH